MKAGALSCVFLCLWTTGGAPAQDRPPQAPAGLDGRAAQVNDDDPPAEKPAQSPLPENDAQTDAGAANPGLIGPPQPPRWWSLRETDQDHAACRLALASLGTVYDELDPITDPADRDCGIARPIRVSRILPDLTLDGGAVMRCDTARALGFWARDFLRPAAATLPGAPRVTAMQLGTAYACRPRIGDGAEAAQLSEHAFGNAIDITAFSLAGSEDLAVKIRADSGDRAEAFQRAIRGAACLFFTTVLGPGTNAAHAAHLHFDLAARRGGWRLCQ